MNITPELVKTLEPNQIFVFGSNEAGRHGAGAAKTAVKWGAIYGVGEGLKGQTYAIPTKDKNIETLNLEYINDYVVNFYHFAKINIDLDFLVTEIGCGLAGLTPEQIAPMFKDASALPNVYLPFRFWQVLVESVQG
jgi:hypothetical protein